MSSPRSFLDRGSYCQPATLALWLSTAAALLSFLTSQAVAANEVNGGNSRQLMAAAAQAEVDGNDARRLTLLRTLLQNDPENETARWQTGQIKVDGRWLSVGDAQQRSATSPLQAEYRQRRVAAGENVQDQIKLARWCRDNRLADEAQLHWAIVLLVSPTNKEALRATDCMLVDGKVEHQTASIESKRRSESLREAAKYWEPRLAKWRRAIGGHDVVAHDTALAEIRAINRLDAIPIFERVTLGRDAFHNDSADECQQIAVAYLTALKNLPDHAATESIVRHAVLAPGKKVRSIATAELRTRDQHDYVPMLLAGMAMPIESSYTVSATPDGSVRYLHSLYQQGQTFDRAMDISSSTEQYYFPGREYRYYTKQRKLEEIDQKNTRMPAVAVQSGSTYLHTASKLESDVASANRKAELLSMRIVSVLSETTEKAFQSPNQWWDWWRDNNEYYSSDHPVDRRYYSESSHYYYGMPSDCITHYDPSCFIKGTSVWTKNGPASIEAVELGDFVLAQDVKTGELTYKPVLAKTVRPPSKMLSISLDGEDITTTLGHPFWVAGIGWRMAKELGDGAQLHGVSGAKRVSAVKPAGEAEAYNLVVADNSTYFVGSSGLLVHDNTPRESAHVIVPGVSKE